MKNYLLQAVIKALNYKMGFQNGRKRNAFFRVAIPKLQEIEARRTEMLNKFAIKKEDGIFELDEKGQCKFTDENMKIYQEEYEKLMEEDCNFDFKAMGIKLGDITTIINESKAELSTLDVEQLESFMNT